MSRDFEEITCIHRVAQNELRNNSNSYVGAHIDVDMYDMLVRIYIKYNRMCIWFLHQSKFPIVMHFVIFWDGIISSALS